ncbi:hypothetical protein [Dendronalium phyllosphericum]|nr:hypothetical protein [Dendronalium phyllosphericum]
MSVVNSQWSVVSGQWSVARKLQLTLTGPVVPHGEIPFGRTASQLTTNN